MRFKYFIYNSVPVGEVLYQILGLHEDIFGTADDLINKMSTKPHLLVITAMDGKKVIGYKMGYSIDNDKFYSWLGGVNSDYRKHGIASTLMEQQHQFLKNKGYQIVRTKTMNKWRDMLILNIKNGFDVIGTYKDEEGRHKIILEKRLLD